MAMPGRGSSRITPILSVTSGGTPHVILAIGPTRNGPACGGNTRCRSPMIRGALATTSVGNRMLSSDPSLRPASSASRLTVRFNASSPPTPRSMNPNGSGMGGMSEEIRISSEKPALPSGIRVLTMPSA